MDKISGFEHKRDPFIAFILKTSAEISVICGFLKSACSLPRRSSCEDGSVANIDINAGPLFRQPGGPDSDP